MILVEIDQEEELSVFPVAQSSAHLGAQIVGLIGTLVEQLSIVDIGFEEVVFIGKAVLHGGKLAVNEQSAAVGDELPQKLDRVG